MTMSLTECESAKCFLCKNSNVPHCFKSSVWDLMPEKLKAKDTKKEQSLRIKRFRLLNGYQVSGHIREGPRGKGGQATSIC